MAAGTLFACSGCRREIIAWDDGDPYAIDPDGTKRYVHHPDPERDRAVALDIPHLCLACGREVVVDSETPDAPCPRCQRGPLCATMALDGVACPQCHTGHFVRRGGELIS